MALGSVRTFHGGVLHALRPRPRERRAADGRSRSSPAGLAGPRHFRATGTAPPWLLMLVALVACLPLLTTAAGAAGATTALARSGVFEVDVMNEPVRGGEPELAINPRNPQDIVMGHTVVGNTYAHDSLADMLKAVPGGLQVSFDGGRTWTPDDRPLPTRGYSEGPNAFLLAHGQAGAVGFTLRSDGVGDPIEAAGPDGSIYAGGVMAYAAPGGPPPFDITVDQGAIAVFRSANGGRSFGRLHAVLSDQDLAGMVRRGMHPTVGGFGVNPFDRPWMVVDQSTGAVYVSTTAHPERYVVVSEDKARTWGRVEALDCDELPAPNPDHQVRCDTYPESGDGNIAAAHGVLAATYIAGAAPRESCPCAIFETSTDAGAHWSRHVVFADLPSGSDVFVAADPSRKGRYAVALLAGQMVPGGLAGLPATKTVPQGVEVTTTRDSGRTWSNPTVLGDQPVPHLTNRPWIAYGPTGVLAVLWRNAYPPYNPGSFLAPGDQNVFVAISRDGTTFSAPIRLNAAPSPPPDPHQLAEDDVSWVAVTSRFVYGAWGDWRPTSGNPVAAGSSPPSGELNAWMARVPLGSFKAEGPSW